jgi:hypothetical protein
MGRQPCPVENVGSPIYKKQNTNKKSPNRNKKSHNINMGSTIAVSMNARS